MKHPSTTDDLWRLAALTHQLTTLATDGVLPMPYGVTLRCPSLGLSHGQVLVRLASMQDLSVWREWLGADAAPQEVPASRGTVWMVTVRHQGIPVTLQYASTVRMYGGVEVES